jgi:hypothetical protein
VDSILHEEEHRDPKHRKPLHQRVQKVVNPLSVGSGHGEIAYGIDHESPDSLRLDDPKDVDDDPVDLKLDRSAELGSYSG